MPWPHLLVLVLLTLLAGVGAALAARGRPRAARGVVLGVVLVLLPLQLLVVRHPWILASLTGWADVLFYAELYPVLVALAGPAAVLGQEKRGPRIRTGLLVGLLALAAFAATGLPTPANEYPPAWVDEDGVVRQTRPSSCAAAAAATLLRAEGIRPQATEAELATLCFTHPEAGTRDLGLYRGLRLASERGVSFVHPSLEALQRDRRAAIVFVGLSDARADPDLYRVLRDECGWAEGVVHAVVCYGFDAGREGEDTEVALIGDPRYGYERWGITHFRALWTGQALVIDALE